MAWFFAAALSLLALSHVSEAKLSQTESIKFEVCNPNDNDRIYKSEFFAEDIERTTNISLADFAGKVRTKKTIQLWENIFMDSWYHFRFCWW